MKRGKKTLRHSFGIVFIAARFHGLLPAAETRMTVAPPFFFFFLVHFLSRSATGKQFWQCVLSRYDRPSPPHRVDTIAARQTFSGRILVHHHYRSEGCKSSHTFGRVCAPIHVNADGEPSPSRESARQIFHVWKRDLPPHVSPTLPTPPPFCSRRDLVCQRGSFDRLGAGPVSSAR